MEIADRDTLYADPLHPYTKALLDAVPIPDPQLEAKREYRVLGGEVPSPLESAARLRVPHALPAGERTSVR